jgi:hypothetical protein
MLSATVVRRHKTGLALPWEVRLQSREQQWPELLPHSVLIHHHEGSLSLPQIYSVQGRGWENEPGRHLPPMQWRAKPPAQTGETAVESQPAPTHTSDCIQVSVSFGKSISHEYIRSGMYFTGHNSTSRTSRYMPPLSHRCRRFKQGPWHKNQIGMSGLQQERGRVLHAGSGAAVPQGCC